MNIEIYFLVILILIKMERNRLMEILRENAMNPAHNENIPTFVGGYRLLGDSNKVDAVNEANRMVYDYELAPSNIDSYKYFNPIMAYDQPKKGGCSRCCGKCGGQAVDQNNQIIELTPDQIRSMMDFQDNGKMYNNRESEIMQNLGVNMEDLNAPRTYQPDPISNDYTKYGFGMPEEGYHEVEQPQQYILGDNMPEEDYHEVEQPQKYILGDGLKSNKVKMQNGLAEYRRRYNRLKEMGMTPAQIKPYLKKYKLQEKKGGRSFWDDLKDVGKGFMMPFHALESVGKTIAPILPLLAV